MKGTRVIRCEIGVEDYLRALRVKRRLRAGSWGELFVKLLRQEWVPRPAEARSREITKLEESIQTLIEQIMGTDQTALEEVLSPERKTQIAHTRKMIKVLLERLKGDLD